MKTTKLLAFSLAALTLVSALTACGSSSSSGGASAGAPAAASSTKTKQSPEEKRAAEADNLPDANYNGASFTILAADTSANAAYVDIAADKETGDVENDKIYARNSAVAEKFGVKFAYKTAKADALAETANTSAAAADGAYDLVVANANAMTAAAMAGSLTDIKSMSGMDLSAKWWAQGANDAMTVGGKLYQASGDLSATMYDMMYCIFFNQDLVDGNSLKSPVALYDGDAWTFERYSQLCIDGGRSYTGGVSNAEGFPVSLMAALNMNGVKMDDSGYPTLDFNSKKAVATAESLKAMFKSKSVASSASAAAPQYMQKSGAYEGNFLAGTTLFMNGFVSDVTSDAFKGIAFNYSFVPLPKYDEYQKSYAQTAYAAYTTASFVNGMKDAAMSGVIAEALAVYGYKQVVLQGIYARAAAHGDKTDDNAASVLNSMRNTFTVDFSVIHGLPMSALLESIAAGNTADFDSGYKENEADYKEAVKEIAAAYKG